MLKRKLRLSMRYISAQDYYNIFNKLDFYCNKIFHSLFQVSISGVVQEDSTLSEYATSSPFDFYF